MKEIKFRAWIYDRLNKAGAMYYSKDFADSNGSLLQYFEERCCLEEDSLMQFTGLKDKNGREIYEGDIVKILIYREYIGSPSKKDKYRNEIVERGCPCGLNTNGMISTKLESEAKYTPQMEVIGNIHENPELIR